MREYLAMMAREYKKSNNLLIHVMWDGSFRRGERTFQLCNDKNFIRDGVKVPDEEVINSRACDQGKWGAYGTSAIRLFRAWADSMLNAYRAKLNHLISKRWVAPWEKKLSIPAAVSFSGGLWAFIESHKGWAEIWKNGAFNSASLNDNSSLLFLLTWAFPALLISFWIVKTCVREWMIWRLKRFFPTS